MKILPRYLAVSILQVIFVVSLIFIGLDFFILFVTQLNELGRADYNILQALIFVVCTLPQQFYSLFPLVVLLGCLIGLGMLASHSELIVMRSAGISLIQIIGYVLKPALILLLLVTLIGEVLGPAAAQYGETTKAMALSGGNALKTHRGLWLRSKNDFVQIAKVVSSQELNSIVDYEMDGQQNLLSASRAQYAKYQDRHWILYDVKKSIITLEGVSVQHFDQLPWNVSFDPKIFKIDSFAPQELSARGLLKLISYQKKNGLQSNQYQLVFWQRFFQPFATAIMIFLAVPFIFGPLRTVTMGLRILIGVTVGFGFYLLNQFFGPLTLVFQLPPVMTAALPPILFLVVGWLLLKRA